jgi:hypothetical protein
MRLWVVAITLGLSVACVGGGGECGAAECAAYCPPAAAPTAVVTPSGGTAAPAAAAGGGDLSTFEHGLVDPMLDDLRQGVRPWAADSVGICSGTGRDCTQFLGVDGGELTAPGDYMVRAELRVPKIGEKGTWKVRFETNCEITKQGSGSSTSTTTNTSSKEYDVQYAGEEHGSRLSPLYTITSPSKYGAQKCTYTLTSLNPDNEQKITGSWSVPPA